MKKIFQVFILSVIAIGITWGLSQLRALSDFEAETVDIRQLAFAPETKVSDDIVIVSLDEATMRKLPYRTPIPRDFLAILTEKIAAAEPKLVGYDIYFADPSFPEADMKLAAVLKKIPAYAVAPLRLDGSAGELLPLFAEALHGVGLADLPFNPFDATVREAQLVFPSVILNEVKDPLLQVTSGDSSPMAQNDNLSFAALLYQAATGQDASTLVGTSPFTIRFAGPPPAFTTYSATLVAKGLVPAAWLKDKIVLIGAGYEDLKDAYLTPYYAKLTNYARMNGVEVHANILNDLLTQQFYRELIPWQRCFIVVLCVLLVCAATFHLSPWKSSLVYVMIAGGIAVFVMVVFQRAAVIVPIVLPFAGATVSFGLGLGFKALTEGRQKRWIKGVFSQYVPRQVVDRMIDHPEMVKLGGEKRIVTSLFSDIESFTTISEKLDPETLVKFLNDYLGQMNAVLFQYGATIDKYEGDAIIAFFNAPLDVKDHESAAVQAALGMQRASREVTKAWKDVVGRDVVTRIGINTGPAVIGNMGSADRFDYTAIGDTINLASRLEGTNKTYNTRILCSEVTAKALSKDIATRFVDRIQVKGKEQAIGVYEIIEEKL